MHLGAFFPGSSYLYRAEVIDKDANFADAMYWIQNLQDWKTGQLFVSALQNWAGEIKQPC